MKQAVQFVAGGVAAFAFLLSCGDGAEDGAGAAPGAEVVTLEQPVTMKTADSDPSRITHGVATYDDGQVITITNGPFIVTDLVPIDVPSSEFGNTILYFVVPKATGCTQAADRTAVIGKVD